MGLQQGGVDADSVTIGEDHLWFFPEGQQDGGNKEQVQRRQVYESRRPARAEGGGSGTTCSKETMNVGRSRRSNPGLSFPTKTWGSPPCARQTGSLPFLTTL